MIALERCIEQPRASSVEVRYATLPDTEPVCRSTVFVIGPPCSGKLTFVKRCFPDHLLVDLHDIQNQVMSVRESYHIARGRLIEACKTGDKVLLRHTLMKAKRRPMYIDAVRSVLGSDARISCYYSLPDFETYRRYDLSDLEEWRKRYPGRYSRPKSDEELRMYLEGFEVPQLSEGFAEIHCIQSLAGEPRFLS